MTLPGIQNFYFVRLAAAAVRGAVLSGRAPDALDSASLQCSLDSLSPEDCARIVQHGLAAGLRLHRFKRTMLLPRVTRILGWLRGLAPESLLDLGSGRGAFLWPLLDAFPLLPVTSLEVSPTRAAQLAEVAAGGLTRLTILQGDITTLPDLPPRHHLVTALEVWEHIPDVAAAARRSVDLSRQAVLISVPSRPDDNPEHIHLLTRDRLQQILDLPRVHRLHFDSVPGHLLALATLRDHA